MSKKCRIIVYSILGLVSAIVLWLVIFLMIHYGVFTPRFVLCGESKVILKLNETYQEEGVVANYHFQSRKDEVVIYSNVDTSKIGTYKVTYQLPSLNKKITRSVVVIDDVKPSIKLRGGHQVYTFIGNEYTDEGASANDNYDGDITNEIRVKSFVDTSKEGKYRVNYEVQDSSGNKTKAIRYVSVVKNPMRVRLHYNYDDYDNKMVGWWFKKSNDHKQNEAAWDKKMMKQYDAYYLGENKKVIYLTFDEGGSETTYIKEIAAILNRYEIRGTFYLTRNYIMEEKDFVRELVASGHVIGNHTRNHLDMSTLANAEKVDEFVEEVTSVEKAYMQVTGKKMIKTFRFPKGEASERTLKMMQDLGYRSFFWSHAYYDYGPKLSFKEAYDAMINYYHPGAIYLIHPNNEGNYLALETFIQEMLEKGYEFKTVDEII